MRPPAMPKSSHRRDTMPRDATRAAAMRSAANVIVTMKMISGLLLASVIIANH
jgi:hypothetical protein